jgi:hypothetical protein
MNYLVLEQHSTDSLAIILDDNDCSSTQDTMLNGIEGQQIFKNM